MHFRNVVGSLHGVFWQSLVRFCCDGAKSVQDADDLVMSSCTCWLSLGYLMGRFGGLRVASIFSKGGNIDFESLHRSLARKQCFKTTTSERLLAQSMVFRVYWCKIHTLM